MVAETQQTRPKIPPVERNNIPQELKETDRWVVWHAGPIKPNGKFDKIPYSPTTGRNINGQDPENWLTYQAALAAHDRGKGDGIGIVLSPAHTLQHNGEERYLVALDFDKCEPSMAALKELWLRLGQPYVETSPSGKGLRMFALSTELLKGGNDGNGHEMYCSGRFMTVTGLNGRGQIKDATTGLVELHQQWFGTKNSAKKRADEFDLGSNILPCQRPETEQNIALAKEQLSFVSSDTAYQTWRDIVWSIQSTGWSCAEAIAREWSMKASERYDEAAFDILVRDFDPSRGITLGTLHHHAVQNGWTPPAGSHLATLHVADCAVDPENQRRADPLLTAEEVKALPNLPYLVRGLLPAKGVASVYGESGSGKSFLAMDLCFAIAAGHPEWFDMPVKPAPVVYIALEGRGGISKRIKAWEAHYKTSVSEQVRFILGNFTLLNERETAILAPRIIAAVGVGAVVVVDTLNQSAPGADENSSADMSTILTNAKNLADQVQGLVVLIHHAGKDRARGMRGHSSLYAAMDAVIEVGALAGGRSWTVAKAKDDEGGICHDFELVPYVVDVDEDGFDVTSCAIRRALNAPIVKIKPLSGKHQTAAMVRLRQLLAGNSVGITHSEAVKEVAGVLSCAPARAATVAKETIDRLLVNGHLCLNEGEIKLP